MLVHLEQYDHDDVDDAVRSEGDVDPDRDQKEYFGEDDVGPEEWERVTEGGETLLRRSISKDGVTAVSVPQEESDDTLPGKTIQLRIEGGETYVENAEIVEVQDSDP